MHLLMFVMVKTVELATDITSRASISADSYFEHSFYIHHAHFRAALAERRLFFLPWLLIFSAFFAFVFPFHASEM